jgi:hypothetical protein
LAFADYIFAIIVEESGVVGAFGLIFLYLAILFRACNVSSRYSALSAIGERLSHKRRSYDDFADGYSETEAEPLPEAPKPSEDTPSEPEIITVSLVKVEDDRQALSLAPGDHIMYSHESFILTHTIFGFEHLIIYGKTYMIEAHFPDLSNEIIDIFM